MINSGVYIGADLELAVTKDYIISFRRSKQADLLESRLFKNIDHTYSCIGVCQSSPAETEQQKPPMCWKTAFVYNGAVSGVCRRFVMNQEIRYDRPPEYQKEPDEQITSYIGSTLNIKAENETVTVEFEDGVLYPAVLSERFTEQTLRPAVLPQVCDENIGECLRLWNMGMNEEFIDIDGESTFIGITLNTNRHMYIFEITPNSIYCRAARFAATNQGVVFNQNFRQGFEAYMIKDNSEACLPLEVDESLFSSEACTWNNRSVYWSVSSYHDHEIELHGCQGDVYHWVRPTRE